MIAIYFFDEENPDEAICSRHFPSCPFKEGQEIKIMIRNKKPDMWDQKSLSKKFKVKEISYFLEDTYTSIASLSTTAYITLTEIEK